MTTANDIELIFRTHYTEMHRLAMLILRDAEASRDIVHDVFEWLLTTGMTDVSAQYLLRAVRNRCINHLRNLSTRDKLNTRVRDKSNPPKKLNRQLEKGADSFGYINDI